MRLWEELSGSIFKKIAAPYLKAFREKSPEKILNQSLEMIDSEVQQALKNYIKNCQDPSGGFKDRAGKPDIYYTIFGYFLADALALKELMPSIRQFTEDTIRNKNLQGVHLHCSAILFSKLCNDYDLGRKLKNQVRQELRMQENQPGYKAFMSLLSCYYLNDFRGLYMINNQLEHLNGSSALPSPVIASMLVLHHAFGKPEAGLKQDLFECFTATGGFKAVRTAPVPDLLSTAVSLYALRFSGHDLRIIKPECLGFIDLLFKESGFSANVLDPDQDIEYTFYGLLALGSLAD